MLGCFLISTGAAMIYIPAGLIVAGLCFIGIAFMLGKVKSKDVI